MIPDVTVFWVARREDGRIMGGAEEVWTQVLGPTGWTDALIIAEDFQIGGPARDEWSEMFGELLRHAINIGLIDDGSAADPNHIYRAPGPWRIEMSAETLRALDNV